MLESGDNQIKKKPQVREARPTCTCRGFRAMGAPAAWQHRNVALLATSRVQAAADRGTPRQHSFFPLRNVGSSSESNSSPLPEDYTDVFINEILRGDKTIAMVGASPNFRRPSYANRDPPNTHARTRTHALYSARTTHSFKSLFFVFDLKI
jgi:hypothetical protein